MLLPLSPNMHTHKIRAGVSRKKAMIRIIRADECRKMPWKNGGGETTEIALVPAGAGMEDFSWRLSMALVASSGPFSSFPGIDRTLAVLEGGGLELAVAGMAPATVTPTSQPLAFPGDAPTTATLIDDKVTDLNIMTRRGRISHLMQRLVVAGRKVLASEADEMLVFCHSGTLQVIADGEAARLSALDTLHLPTAPAALQLEADSPVTLFVIGLTHMSG